MAAAGGAARGLFESSVDLTGVFIAQRRLQDTMLGLTAHTAGALLVGAAFAASRAMKETVLVRS